ncbi:MAG TPA: DUF4129 domain-containing protein [Caulobacteraceae bacterium]|nr:DUF4129 domain-containing protein [Caulobacteraceae bacterium]
MAAESGVFAAGAAPSAQALRAAQARLMRDGALQFRFGKAAPPHLPHLPHWLQVALAVLGRGLSAVAPAFGWIFAGGVAIAAGLVLFFIARELTRTRWPGLFSRRPRPSLRREDWKPQPAAARALLAEADALAAAGEYGEAVHLILHRSIEEIDGRRPRLVRPALTSREIAGLAEMPAAARATFTPIAELVERSFFGGLSVDAGSYARCRDAYRLFALEEAWA